jgi:hypothetical protein
MLAKRGLKLCALAVNIVTESNTININFFMALDF